MTRKEATAKAIEGIRNAIDELHGSAMYLEDAGLTGKAKRLVKIIDKVYEYLYLLKAKEA